MRNRFIISGGVASVGVLALLLLSLGDPVTSETSASHDKGSASKAAPLLAVRTAPRLTKPSDEKTLLGKVTALPVRTIAMSSKERRSGETDQNYMFRMKFIEKFDKLIRQAELTPEQIPLVLERFADAQEQSELAWVAMDESLSSIGSLVSIPVMSRTLSSDLFTSLREVISHEQMVRYRHISIIGSPIGFGLYKPLEIQREKQE